MIENKHEHFSEWTPLKNKQTEGARYDVRQEVLSYLDRFFSNFILHRDFPVKQKLARKHWVDTFYEELTQEDREEIFKQLKRDQSTLDKNELGHN